MKVRVRRYNDNEGYINDEYTSERIETSITMAISKARVKLAKARTANKFLAYRIFDMTGKEKYKLPSY